jgi:GNAT superfamily N-acetyltransferase
MDEVFQAMDQHFAHTRWRVVHTDTFTPDACLARLALEGYLERPVTIQMALHGELTDRGTAIDLYPVTTDADWESLLQLVIADHAEGLRTGGLDISPDVSAAMIAAFSDQLRAAGCCIVFLGALAGERAQNLYARLGFSPVTVSRSWVQDVGAITAV